jgi:hypothetical protein
MRAQGAEHPNRSSLVYTGLTLDHDFQTRRQHYSKSVY